MILDLESRTHKITNEKGQIVHVSNAKTFWLAGEVEDCSLSFQRLASLDFNFDALDKFYNDNP